MRKKHCGEGGAGVASSDMARNNERPAASAPERLANALLVAVSDGRLSVEEVVRAAVSSRGFQREAGRMLRAATHVENQTHRLRTVRHEPALLRKAQRMLKRKLARQPDVHVGIGRHYRRGLPQDEFGLVVHVHHKRDVPEDEAVQPLQVKRGAVTYTFRPDVKQIERAEKQTTVRPGNQAVVGSDVNHGTLSAIVPRASGPVALMSGHVARTSPAGTIRARTVGGMIVELGQTMAIRDDATMDAAVIGPVPPSEVAVLALGPAKIRDPASVVEGIKVSVLVTEHDGPSTAFVDDVDVPATFVGGTTMTGLIALRPRVTEHGDSGAAVLDDDGRVLGFVVGASAARTFVIPAKGVLDEMLGV
jgi:hypothetical protein